MRWRLRASVAVLSLVCLVGSTGCSVMLAERPGASVARDVSPRCSTSSKLVIADWVLVSALFTAGAIALDQSADSDGTGLVALESATAVALVVRSAVLGGRWRRTCLQQRADHDAWLADLARQRGEDARAERAIGAPGTVAPVLR